MRIYKTILYSLSFMLFNACNNKVHQFKLTADNAINKQDIKIQMEVLASVPITEIYNGEKQFEIPNGYGENEWYFTYKDTLKGYLRHIKTNRNDRYSYEFFFHKVNEKYFVDVDIKGADSIKQVVELKAK